MIARNPRARPAAACPDPGRRSRRRPGWIQAVGRWLLGESKPGLDPRVPGSRRPAGSALRRPPEVDEDAVDPIPRAVPFAGQALTRALARRPELRSTLPQLVRLERGLVDPARASLDDWSADDLRRAICQMECLALAENCGSDFWLLHLQLRRQYQQVRSRSTAGRWRSIPPGTGRH